MYEIALMSYWYSSDCTCTRWWHSTWCDGREEYINGEWLTLRRYQMCRRQATNETRKEGLKNYA